MLTPELPHIPRALKSLKQWVCWKQTARNGKVTKPPHSPATGKLANCNDPKSWTTFDEAMAACSNGNRRFAGVGFVLSESDGLVGIDLDRCRDPKTGEVEPWAKDIIDAANSYTEVSPSGQGVHIFVKGELPAGGRKNGNIEMYDRERYFTVTGQHLEGTPSAIENRQQQLEALHTRVFGGDQQNEKATESNPASAISDEELVSRAMQSANKDGDHTFKKLWEANWKGGHKSQSEASLALCKHLAFWAGKDAARINELFRLSGLYDRKWERADYRKRTIAKAISSTTDTYSPPAVEGEHREGGNISKFLVSDDGVFFCYRDEEGKKRRTRICSRLEVVALTRNEEGREWGRLAEVWDPDGNCHQVSLPMEQLAAEGSEIRASLLSRGLRPQPGRSARNLLARYLTEANPKDRVRCVPKVGWHGPHFVLPDETIGPDTPERTIFQPSHETVHYFATAGLSKDWRRRIGELCIGNSRLVFAASCGFAAAMLTPTDEEGGGFHLRGDSSTGKSTASLVAGSVCGGGGRLGYCRTWRSTANGLEAVAELHNDSLLVLDELSELDAREAGDTAYMLANGAGKARMSRTSVLKRSASWCLLVLSNGEISLADHIAAAGKRARAGHLVRLIDIPADAGAGLGIFEDLHEAADADSFARHLSAAARNCYGTPLRDFLAFVTVCQQDAIDDVRKKRDQFVADQIPEGASGEVSRSGRRFGLVVAAGELATELGILPWPAGEATRAAEICFQAHLDARGGAGSADLQQAIRQVRYFIQSQSARFQNLDRPDDVVRDRAGFRTVGDGTRKFSIYFIFPEVFRREICQGYDSGAVARELKRLGFLIAEPGRLKYKLTKAHEGARPRMYAVRGRFLESE